MRQTKGHQRDRTRHFLVGQTADGQTVRQDLAALVADPYRAQQPPLRFTPGANVLYVIATRGAYKSSIVAMQSDWQLT